MTHELSERERAAMCHATAAERPAAREALTVRQREVLTFIEGFIATHGYPPTLREIGVAFSIASTNGVNDHLIALERKGYVRRDVTKSRGIALCHGMSDETLAKHHRAELAKVEARIAARKAMRDE
jgi:SOS-response transcriptional repressor LexA